MAKTIDLSSKFSLKSSIQELEIPLGTPSIGERVGGMSVYQSSFRRGYGDQVFGQDENGIWLGSANFSDAPFKVNMDGQLTATGGNGAIQIDNVNGRIVFYDENNVPIGLLGYHENGF